MKTMSTTAKIRDIIEAGMEDTARADRLYAAIVPFAGKLLSQPIADKIANATGETIRIRRQYGMTNLIVGGYDDNRSEDRGLSILLAHSEKNVYVDMGYIDAQNIAYFDAAKRRNAKRREELADEAEIAALAQAIDAFNEAHAILKAKLKDSDTFDASRYPLQKLLATYSDRGHTSGSAGL